MLYSTCVHVTYVGIGNESRDGRPYFVGVKGQIREMLTVRLLIINNASAAPL